MKNRFYVGGLPGGRGPLELSRRVWVHDGRLLDIWQRRLRLAEGDQVVLIDGQGDDRLYKIFASEPGSVGLQLVTQLEPNFPPRHVYLFWRPSSPDTDRRLLQTAARLGARNFIPLLGPDRSDYADRQKQLALTAIEAATPHWSFAPQVRQPVSLAEALGEYQFRVRLYLIDRTGQNRLGENHEARGLILPPAAGWSEDEQAVLAAHRVVRLDPEVTGPAQEVLAATLAKLLQ